MHSKLAPAIAHHHGAVPRKATAIDTRQAERLETREQLRRVSRRALEREIELVLRPREQAA
jgi:hypothetical protein